MSLINPFELFGLNINKNINIKHVNQIYHNFAQLTHPDKGGKKEDFIMIHQAYKYIKEQVVNSKEMKEMDVLEKEFEDFCKNNPIKKLPTLLDIRDDTALFNQRFNKEFEKKMSEDKLNLFKNNGYGSIMDESDIILEEAEVRDDCFIKLDNKFTMEIQKYEEPESMPMDGYGSYQRFDVDEVNNFGNIPQKLYDYKESHSEKNPTPKINDIIEDKPITNLEEKVKEILKERKELKISEKKIFLNK